VLIRSVLYMFHSVNRHTVVALKVDSPTSEFPFKKLRLFGTPQLNDRKVF